MTRVLFGWLHTFFTLVNTNKNTLASFLKICLRETCSFSFSLRRQSGINHFLQQLLFFTSTGSTEAEGSLISKNYALLWKTIFGGKTTYFGPHEHKAENGYLLIIIMYLIYSDDVKWKSRKVVNAIIWYQLILHRISDATISVINWNTISNLVTSILNNECSCVYTTTLEIISQSSHCSTPLSSMDQHIWTRWS